MDRFYMDCPPPFCPFRSRAQSTMPTGANSEPDCPHHGPVKAMPIMSRPDRMVGMPCI